MKFFAFALGIVTPWGQDSRSEAWFWEMSGKRERSRLPPEYSPTAHICAGTPKVIASEVADFCALVKESVQAECRDKMLAFWHDRGAAADAKGVKSTTTSDSTISS